MEVVASLKYDVLKSRVASDACKRNDLVKRFYVHGSSLLSKS